MKYRCCFDSRKLSSPQETLFFAIETKQNDAHKFISDLYGSGVRNFVVTKLFPEWKSFTDVNFLKVTNTLHALQKLAAYHLKQFSIPVIGITGSNGKTIVKEWLYQLLEEDYNITRSPRSYNSQTGVPLSVWEMTENTTLAIFEAGISQPDEMKYLEPVIRPTIGFFTNLLESHQENFSSQQQKCMEKMELFVNSNVFIYEEDNKIINQSADRMVLSQKSFCWSRKDPDAPLYIRKTEKNGNKTTIHYSFPTSSTPSPYHLNEASIENAISCLAVMLYLNVKPGTISERMMKLETVAMRLDVRQGKNNCTIINDTYNSDINSIKIALDFQQQRKVEQSLKKTLIISDILQTGLLPKSLYKHVAELVQQSGIEKLIGIGHDICENSEVSLPGETFFPSTEDFIRSIYGKNSKTS